MSDKGYFFKYGKTIAERDGGYFCFYCGRDIDPNKILEKQHIPTIDHKVPRSVLPKLSEDLNNMVLSCFGCNAEKGDDILFTTMMKKKSFIRKKNMKKYKRI